MDVNAIVEQLKGIRCATTIRQKGLKVMSCPDAIGKVIEKVMKLQNIRREEVSSDICDMELNEAMTGTPQRNIDDANPNKMAVCPECGKAVEHEGGCVVCRNCGYSKCG